MEKESTWISARRRLPLAVDSDREFSRVVKVKIVNGDGLPPVCLGYADLSSNHPEWYLLDVPMNENYQVTHWQYL